MKKIFYLLLLMVNTSFAQTTIKGKITDTKGEALIGVNIAVKNSYDGATSNATGEFSFETSEKDSVIITATYIGYVPQEKKVLLNAKNVIVNFSIKEKINDLKAVVISAGSFEASDEKKGTVLKALDIVTTAGSNGDSYGALKTLPGAQQTNDREGLFVRGGTGVNANFY
ncbi:MAG: carboxypeptidase-like regulatory domain-containing protein [Bacteroidetes bacterium]|nr:carboxypeptidase-like regulatory domain-containing protein [Bacteroidota bacterium]